jgi:hypothetical protein
MTSTSRTTSIRPARSCCSSATDVGTKIVPGSVASKRLRGVMVSRFTEHEIKELVRKVEELHARPAPLNDHLLSEVFLSENRAKLNRREPNSARETTELAMTRWRKETDVKEALERRKPSY